MIAPLVLDIVGKAADGDPIPAILLTCYALIGAAIYAFYGVKNSHLARGVQVQDAMRDAQRAVMADPETAHPFYWAPFNLIGNWRLKVAK